MSDFITYASPEDIERTEKFWETSKAYANEAAASPGEVEGGSWVTMTGLQSAVGKKLNGKVGQLLKESPNEEGRFPVKIDGEGTKGKLIKECNLIHVSQEDLVKTYRIPARGERSQHHKTLLFPRNHSMFTKCNPMGNAPVMALCGLPLVVQKIQSSEELPNQADRDNQWATWLMIEPETGFAPWQWQSNVGPVLVYRPGGKLDFSSDDMNVTNLFLSALLDEYPEDDFDHAAWLNPSNFQRFVRKCQREAQINKMGSSLNHLNILN